MRSRRSRSLAWQLATRSSSPRDLELPPWLGGRDEISCLRLSHSAPFRDSAARETSQLQAAAATTQLESHPGEATDTKSCEQTPSRRQSPLGQMSGGSCGLPICAIRVCEFGRKSVCWLEGSIATSARWRANLKISVIEPPHT